MSRRVSKKLRTLGRRTIMVLAAIEEGYEVAARNDSRFSDTLADDRKTLFDNEANEIVLDAAYGSAVFVARPVE